MSLDPNPFRWSANVKTMGGLLALVGSIWGSADYIGGKIYHFAEIQTAMLAKINGVQTQLSEAKAALADENVQRDRSLGALKGEVVPRIEKLETSVSEARADTAAAKQRADDLKEQIGDIKNIALQSLGIARSHDADIRATRRAVAPKAGDFPPQ